MPETRKPVASPAFIKKGVCEPPIYGGQNYERPDFGVRRSTQAAAAQARRVRRRKSSAPEPSISSAVEGSAIAGISLVRRIAQIADGHVVDVDDGMSLRSGEARCGEEES